MSDESISERIERLVAEEHELRSRGQGGLAGGWVARVARVGAGGHLQADAMARRESVADRPKIEGHPHALIRCLGRAPRSGAHQCVAYVPRGVEPVDVANPREEV